VLGQHEAWARVRGGDRAAEAVEQDRQPLAPPPQPRGALEPLAAAASRIWRSTCASSAAPPSPRPVKSASASSSRRR
jgi:hypothetical protein